MRVEGGFDGLPMQIAIRWLAETSGGRVFGNTRTVKIFSCRSRDARVSG